MKIAAIGYKNYIARNFGTNNNSNTASNVHLKNTPIKDTVEFTGATKCLSNIYDKAFVNILEQDLNLTKEAATKLKNIVWDFLRKYKVNSLGELGGEDFFDEQVELQGIIMKKLNLPEDMSEFIAREVINRCDEGEKYIPGGLRGLERERELEDALLKLDGRRYLETSFEQDADNVFYEHARKALRLSPEENYEFRAAIEDYLKDHNFKALKDMGGEDTLNEQAELVEMLGNKFNLSESEVSAIDWEIMARSRAGINYKPITNPFVKDWTALRELLTSGGYGAAIGSEEAARTLQNNLYYTMSCEAGEKGYQNIFEIFLEENNPKTSNTFKFIQDLKLPTDKKVDLVVDLAKAAKEPEEAFARAPKHIGGDNFYGSIYNDMITDKILQKYDLPEIISDDIRNTVAKLHPTHVDGGENCDLSQIAFEIADKYHLPPKAEKEIIAIITDILNSGTKKADVYFISKLMKGE